MSDKLQSNYRRLDCDYDDERDTTELARRCMDEINYLTGTTNMPDAGKACQWAKVCFVDSTQIQRSFEDILISGTNSIVLELEPVEF